MLQSHWNGKTAIICGASAGLGRSFARELATQGARHLILVARRLEGLESLQQELCESFDSCMVESYAVDLGESQSVRDCVSRIKQSGEGIDLLIQAVGQSDRGTIVDLPQERLDELFKSNVLSSLNALQCFVPLLKKPGSHVVFIGSLASFFAPRFMGGYSIAKHALAGLVGQARLELAPQGIQVTMACPGPIAREDAGFRYLETQPTNPEGEMNAGSTSDAADVRLLDDRLLVRSHAEKPVQPSGKVSTEAGALPPDAYKPAAGAKLRGLDERQLARDILRAAAANKPVIIRPRSAYLLRIISALSPRLGEYLVRRNTS